VKTKKQLKNPRPPGLDPSGLLLIDKPSGKTSHDVVATARRVLRTKRVGHAGTLDPMATGLLVVLVGDLTRVASHVTAEDKRYDARVTFGRATDSLDADGNTTETAEIPSFLRDELRKIAASTETAAAEQAPRLTAALAAERARTEQVPPAVSAIHVDGERAHALVRRGETVVLPPRPVKLLDISVHAAAPEGPHPSLDLSVHVSKGYYVRSLARDLGLALGLPAHLSALRRTSSGPLSLADSVPLDGDLQAALVPLIEALRTLFPTAILTPAGAAAARLGKRLAREDFAAGAPAEGLVTAWLNEAEDEVIALGVWEAGVGVVCRGFPPKTSANRPGTPITP
jgi:tRNA pseudouridine55 synthase